MGQVCDLSVLAIEYGKDKLIGYRSISDTVDQDFEIDTVRISRSGKVKRGSGSSLVKVPKRETHTDTDFVSASTSMLQLPYPPILYRPRSRRRPRNSPW